MNNGTIVRQITSNDRDWIERFTIENWCSNIIVSRGKVHVIANLPGFIAVTDEEVSGILSYSIEDDSIEIILLESLIQNKGIGTLLIEKIKERAKFLNKKRIWLITSNDNLDALKFYQKRGFRLVAIHRGAIDDARRIKPEIPYIGNYGIPIRDEIELELIIE